MNLNLKVKLISTSYFYVTRCRSKDWLFCSLIFRPVWTDPVILQSNMSRNASQEFLVSDDSQTRNKLDNGLGELRSKFQKFYSEYKTAQHEIGQQKKTIKENSDKLAELVQLKIEMDRYKERLSISETQNFDKDVIIGELKLQLDKLKTEKDVKIIELNKQIEELIWFLLTIEIVVFLFCY